MTAPTPTILVDPLSSTSTRRGHAALSDDGNRLFVLTRDSTKKCYVYNWTGGAWVEEQNFAISWGECVGCSGDGNVVLVEDGATGFETWRRISGTWTSSGAISFGGSGYVEVNPKLNYDGTLAVAIFTDTSSGDIDKLKTLERSGDTWTEVDSSSYAAFARALPARITLSGFLYVVEDNGSGSCVVRKYSRSGSGWASVTSWTSVTILSARAAGMPDDASEVLYSSPSSDGVVRWNTYNGTSYAANSGEAIPKPSGHYNFPGDVDVAGNGSRVVAVGQDNTTDIIKFFTYAYVAPSTESRAGSAAGTSTALGIALAAMVGTAAGTSTATAVSPDVMRASGTSTALGVGAATARAVGVSAGTSTTLAFGLDVPPTVMNASFVKFRLSGGGVNTLPADSLGGAMSISEIANQGIIYAASAISGITILNAGGITTGTAVLKWDADTESVSLKDPADGDYGVAVEVLESDVYSLTGLTTGSIVVLIDRDATPGTTTTASFTTTIPRANLFPNASREAITFGQTIYRCFYLYNSHPTESFQNILIFLPNPDKTGNETYGTTYRLGLDPAGESDGVLGVPDIIESPATIPAGVTFFEANDEASALEIDGITALNGVPIWVERTLTAQPDGAPTFKNDFANFTVLATYDVEVV